MPPLPQLSGDEAVKAFEKLGYERVRQKGSHIRLVSNEPGRNPLTVPRKKELKRGMLRSLIRDAGISVEEFIELL
ncbi:type II toxin-antitoxin system HicA family toxin [Rubrobacter naiadicus]|uniref:type II toxin-antitoxin system HicA family toxin n=1 Tax=Rubrobacter naiadicus TaxID=1392641 RepID=UPI00235FFF7A|nr:type II toxin-antitoxin system HicA family toxin [Rubrobacter naiadicus]